MALMTVREVADELRVSPMTVRRYISSGKLRAVRVGRGVRVEQSALQGLVQPLRPAADTAELGTPSSSRGSDAVEPGVITFEDSLWNIVGIIKDGPPDLARNHDKYLADAYADRHEG